MGLGIPPRYPALYDRIYRMPIDSMLVLHIPPDEVRRRGSLPIQDAAYNYAYGFGYVVRTFTFRDPRAGTRRLYVVRVE